MRIESLQDSLAYFPDIDDIWNGGDLNDVEIRLRARLPEEFTGPWEAKALGLLTQLARIQALRAEFNEARATLKNARDKIVEADAETNIRLKLRCTLEDGRIHGLARSPAKAHELFGIAWELANASNLQFFAIDAAVMLSSILPTKQQNEWLQKALTLAEETMDPEAKLWLAQLYLLDGWHAFDLRRFEDALKRFDQAAVECQSNQIRKHFVIQWSRARVLRAMGLTAEALTIQEKLLNEMNLSGAGVDGHVYLELAECQQLLMMKDEAKGNFELAYTELSRNNWYSDNRSDELERMKYLYKKR
jgi:tetratricopeptide (TPR) repeat protein